MKEGVIRRKLKSGLTLLYFPKKTDSVAVQVMVNVGSNNETPSQAGISHYIEHMVFEGTPKRPSSKLIADHIEEVGGEFNAYTTALRTCFYVKVLKKHVGRAVEILSDIIQNPLMKEEDMKRQPTIINKEIDMIHDEPRLYQWLLFEKTVFKKHPVRNPTYGTKKAIKLFKRDALVAYYHKFYQPKNMTICVVGDVKNVQKLLEEKFRFSGGKLYKPVGAAEPKQRKETKRQRRPVTSSYFIIGYKTVNRGHKDSYTLDVIDAILGKGQSGWLFDEVRSVHGLAYDVGSQHETEVNYGFFAAYASVDKKNIQQAKNLILKQFKKIQKISDQELQKAKDYIEGSLLLDNEDTQKLADNLLFWEHVSAAEDFFKYLKKIRTVTKTDVIRVAKKYLTDKYTMVVVEGK